MSFFNWKKNRNLSLLFEDPFSFLFSFFFFFFFFFLFFLEKLKKYQEIETTKAESTTTDIFFEPLPCEKISSRESRF